MEPGDDEFGQEPDFYRPPPISAGGQPNEPAPDPSQRGKRSVLPYVILAVFLVISLGAGLLFYGVKTLFEGISAPLQELAVEAAGDCPTLVEQMGRPIAITGNFLGLPDGKIETSNNSGTARLNFQLEASKGHGTLSLHAQRLEGGWQPQHLMVEPSGGAPIDLLHCIQREASRELCERGQPDECLRAGILMMTKAAGLPRNDAEGLRFYEAGCKLGHVASCRASETGGASALASEEQKEKPEPRRAPDPQLDLGPDSEP